LEGEKVNPTPSLKEIMNKPRRNDQTGKIEDKISLSGAHSQDPEHLCIMGFKDIEWYKGTW
jgi:hypothetical protein